MVLGRIEKTLGLPPLVQVAETLQKFPDAEQLKLIKEVLLISERVSQSVPELDKVILLIRELVGEIGSMPIEKLERLEKVLKRIEKIMQTAPEELKAVVTSLKEE